MIPLLDLRRSFDRLDRELMDAARRVLRSGRYVLGPEVQRFEKEFAGFCGVSRSVGVASGTDALELSLRAAGIGPGDRVATVSFTFLATLDAITQVGAEPLWVDIDPATYTLDPADLRRRIASLSRADRARLKAVLPVHLYGHPADMDGIGAAAKEFGLKIIEDAAQAAGAQWKGRPVGSLGSAGCFSFFPTKTLGSFGDAGAVVTDSAVFAKKIQSLRVHGRAEDGTQKLHGRNSRLEELQAALLRVKLRVLPEWLKRRREIAAAYTAQLGAVSGILCPREAAGARHAYCLYVLRSRRRDRIQTALRKKGIAAQVYYDRPVHAQPIYRGRFRRVCLPETERACREVLALPIFPEMRSEEIRTVVREVRQAAA